MRWSARGAEEKRISRHLPRTGRCARRPRIASWSVGQVQTAAYTEEKHAEQLNDNAAESWPVRSLDRRRFSESLAKSISTPRAFALAKLPVHGNWFTVGTGDGMENGDRRRGKLYALSFEFLVSSVSGRYIVIDKF